MLTPLVRDIKMNPAPGPLSIPMISEGTSMNNLRRSMLKIRQSPDILNKKAQLVWQAFDRFLLTGNYSTYAYAREIMTNDVSDKSDEVTANHLGLSPVTVRLQRQKLYRSLTDSLGHDFGDLLISGDAASIYKASNRLLSLISEDKGDSSDLFNPHFISMLESLTEGIDSPEDLDDDEYQSVMELAEVQSASSLFSSLQWYSPSSLSYLLSLIKADGGSLDHKVEFQKFVKGQRQFMKDNERVF